MSKQERPELRSITFSSKDERLRAEITIDNPKMDGMSDKARRGLISTLGGFLTTIDSILTDEGNLNLAGLTVEEALIYVNGKLREANLDLYEAAMSGAKIAIEETSGGQEN